MRPLALERPPLQANSKRRPSDSQLILKTFLHRNGCRVASRIHTWFLHFRNSTNGKVMSRGPFDDLSQKHRGHALECIQLARKTKDETERATFFEMARAWLRAASVIDDTLPRYRVHLLDCARLERASATGTKNDR